MLSPLRDRIASLWYGVTLPWTALRLVVRKPSLFTWAAIPIAITLALSIWGVGWAKAKLSALGVAWLAGLGYAPDSWVVVLSLIFLQIALFVLAAISFSLVATLIASPFNDFLSEAVEPFCDPPVPAPPPESTTWRGKVRAVRIDIAKTFAIGFIQLALIVAGALGFWIPGVNLIPLLLAFWLLSFQFVTYPQTRRGEGFRTSLRFLFRYPFSTLGFGAAIGTLFAIPIVSAFALPLAVVGGTLLYARGTGLPAVGKDYRPSRIH
jgi:CysZ protein